jgi:hypothetical protein
MVIMTIIIIIIIMGHEWKESTICGGFQWRVWNGEREVLCV